MYWPTSVDPEPGPSLPGGPGGPGGPRAYEPPEQDTNSLIKRAPLLRLHFLIHWLFKCIKLHATQQQNKPFF